MTSRKRIIWTSVAIAAALTISVPSLSSAQARGSAGGARQQAPAQGAPAQAVVVVGRRPRRRCALYTPAAGAKDLKAVLFNWAWYTGMLRSSEE